MTSLATTGAMTSDPVARVDAPAPTTYGGASTAATATAAPNHPIAIKLETQQQQQHLFAIGPATLPPNGMGTLKAEHLQAANQSSSSATTTTLLPASSDPLVPIPPLASVPPTTTSAPQAIAPPSALVVQQQLQIQQQQQQQQQHQQHVHIQHQRFQHQHKLPKLIPGGITASNAMQHPKNSHSSSVVGSAPATLRASGGATGSGGGGQLLQFPWKLHEMLHLAETNGKTNIISWLPGGNGFKVHNKELFCEEIMPGYFASQKYKTFQRSLNLWGFESVAKGPDRGACYHQYFVKGHPELCHNMTRVKIKGQSNPRTPAAAQAAAAAAAKRAALSSFATQQQPQHQHLSQPPGSSITPAAPLQQQGQQQPQAQQQQQQQQQSYNLLAMIPGAATAPMAVPGLGMSMAPTAAAALAANPYALAAMNQFATMNAAAAAASLHPAFCAAALQNPTMNVMLTAQVAAAAALQAQQHAATMGMGMNMNMAAVQAPHPAAAAMVPAPPSQPQPLRPAPAPLGRAPMAGTFPVSAAPTHHHQQPLAAGPTGGPTSANATANANANANANYAEFLARKTTLERYQPQPPAAPAVTALPPPPTGTATAPGPAIANYMVTASATANSNSNSNSNANIASARATPPGAVAGNVAGPSAADGGNAVAV